MNLLHVRGRNMDDNQSEKLDEKEIGCDDKDNSDTEIVDLSNTAIPEYLEIVKSEYVIERNKKQSFENRAGFILALLGAICIFIFDKVKLNDVFYLMNKSLTFMVLLKIIAGMAVYVGVAVTIIMVLRTINVKKQDNFEVKSINESLISEIKIIALCKIIFTYRDIIIQHRILNEKRAKSFRRSLYGLSLTFMSIIIYLSII